MNTLELTSPWLVEGSGKRWRREHSKRDYRSSMRPRGLQKGSIGTQNSSGTEWRVKELSAGFFSFEIELFNN